MNKWLKVWSIFIFTIGGLLVLLLIGVVLLFLHFRATLNSDESEEAKVLLQAEHYLQANYPTMAYEISGVEYDKGSQYDRFDYAVLILNKETKNIFKVYENKYTKQMEDDIAFQELSTFIEQVKPKVYRYVTATFGEPQGIAFTPSMGAPSLLTIKFSNKNDALCEENFNSFIDYLHINLHIEHVQVMILYDNEQWVKEF